jgi:hypothetical protein
MRIVLASTIVFLICGDAGYTPEQWFLQWANGKDDKGHVLTLPPWFLIRVLLVR